GLPCSASLPVLLLTDTAPTDPYTLSLHDALPIFVDLFGECLVLLRQIAAHGVLEIAHRICGPGMLLAAQAQHVLTADVERLAIEDRKSTRLNSSHVKISYAVFCLKKKTRRYRSIQ